VTLHARIAAARQRLREAGIPDDEADLDARLLAEHVLGWTTEQFFSAGDGPEPAGFADRYSALVNRRAAREPFAYIVGRQEFWGLAFEVSPAVLIPRPETELLVELALGSCGKDADVVIADVCTGSGCVAVAIAHNRPRVRVVATDVSDAALAVAQRNAETHGVQARIGFLRCDLLDGVAGPFDLVVANPPYVAERDRATIQPEVVNHEPTLALFAGDDGLDVIRRLVPASVNRLKPGGALLFEFGYGQDREVEELITNTRGLTMLELRRDFQGIPRVAVAHRSTIGND